MTTQPSPAVLQLLGADAVYITVAAQQLATQLEAVSRPLPDEPCFFDCEECCNVGRCLAGMSTGPAKKQPQLDPLDEAVAVVLAAREWAGE